MTYVLFQGYDYYPGGGAYDDPVVLSAKSDEDATARGRAEAKQISTQGNDWHHVAEITDDGVRIVSEW